MYQKMLRVLLGAAGLLMLAACGGGSDIPSSVSKEARESLQEAFAKADSGRDPMMSCAVFAGAVVGHHQNGNLTQGHVDAFNTCYVEVRLRYFDALLKKEEDKERACKKIGHTGLIWSMALAGSVGKHGVDVAALKKRLLDKARAQLSSVCDEETFEDLAR